MHGAAMLKSYCYICNTQQAVLCIHTANLHCAKASEITYVWCIQEHEEASTSGMDSIPLETKLGISVRVRHPVQILPINLPKHVLDF